ncbi:hypothetical protein [Streptomyces lavendulae]|uniref:hypothetical protein n=1 Tax=Streptomyces lavendulae TaxID=1914 RepID=UPI0033E87A54
MGVHGGVQIGHELLGLFQELWRVGGHRGIEAAGERAEDLVRPLLDVRAAAQGDDAPVGVLAGGPCVELCHGDVARDVASLFRWV